MARVASRSRRRLAPFLILAFLALAPSLPAAATPPAFTGIGDLEGGGFFEDFHSSATAVSGDGSVVVGRATPGEMIGDQVAVRWTAAEGLVNLGGFQATDVSYDGNVIVGDGGFGIAVRWTPGGGMEDLGTLGGATASARGVSADGSVVIGFSEGTSFSEAFRWTAGGGMVALGFLPHPNPQSRASAVSGDGALVVGISRSRPFGWTPSTGMVELEGSSVSEPWGDARSVSADGSTIGGGRGADGWIWREGESFTLLGAPAAEGISGDGLVVVGGEEFSEFEHAYIWDAANGPRNLADFLEQDYGLDLTGWTLHAALDISDDGLTIVGVGTNPAGNREGWVASLPPACSDGLDNDRDGEVDLLDPGCSSADDPSEKGGPELPCDDGLDNDGDGLVDFADVDGDGASEPPGDWGCLAAWSPLEDPQCQDGVNNDNQLGTDFDGGRSVLGVGNDDPNGPDPQCVDAPWKNLERPKTKGCGLGFEIALALGALAGLGGARRRSR